MEEAACPLDDGITSNLLRRNRAKVLVKIGQVFR
jgi:hypothetical protein